MKRPTLLGELLTVQTLVVALACGLLVAGALVTGGFLMRQDQDEHLRALAGSFCHDISTERAEGLQAEAAAREAFSESQLVAYLLELVGHEGAVLASRGDLEGWSPPPGHAEIESCRSVGAVVKGDDVTYRACGARCDDGTAMRVTTVDVLGHPGVRLAAWALVAVLPLAVAGGAAVGRLFFRRTLRPLRELQHAATTLEARPGVSLGVGARVAELADMESAFDSLLARLGEALARERRFSQEASHELRTPLTALRARLERLERDIAAPEARAEASAALADVASLDRLVEALLLLARAETAGLPATPVNLCDVSREVARRQALADGGTRPAPEVVAPDEILVRGSEELLARAVANLVENSRKYAGEGARIRVRVLRENGRGVVVVEDDGPGIPADLRPFAFERFFRGSSHRGRISGAGLGLAVVRAVVARHGGEVRAGRGSMGGEEIRISLPLLSCG